jgi:hypothetical protein
MLGSFVTPEEQLKHQIFKLYELSNSELENYKKSFSFNELMDIDSLPVYAIK